MKHGEKIGQVPLEIFEQDPEMWSSLSMSMTEFLLLERALEDDEDE